jgi:hypothetical protein
MPSLDLPTVSVDRAVWYHVSDLDVDFGAIAEFYGQLDLPAKPPLQACRIHISALAYYWPSKDWPLSGAAPKRGLWSVDGIHLLAPEDTHLLDALAPPANILLLIGNCARSRDYTLVVRRLAFALLHYALGADAYPPMTEEEERLRTELAQREAQAREESGDPAALMAKGIGVALQAGLGVVGSHTLREAGGAFAEGLGFGTVDQAADSKAERAELIAIRRKLLRLASVRDQSAKLPESLGSMSIYEGALQFRLQEGRRLRPPIVSRFDRDAGRISVDMRHLQRGLAVMPLRKWNRPA